MTATGFLSQPRLPDIEGVHDFAGEVIHTAKWDDSAVARRQAGRGDRHRRDGGAADPEDREGGLGADGLPAHADLGHPEDRLPDPPAAAAAVRRTAMDAAARAPRQQRLARGDDGDRGAALPAGAVLQPGRRARSPSATCAKQVADPELRREADARLQLRLQAADVLQRLLPDVHPAARHPGDDADRADHADRDRHQRRDRDARSTPSCSRPASTCGTRTSRRSR